MMRFLTLWRPWTWAIFDPIADKGIENRNWAPPVDLIGHRIAIHAGLTWDPDAVSLFLKLGITHFPNRKEEYPSGGIVGVATLDRVVTTDRTLPPEQKRWFFGKYGWVLTDRVKFTTPVPCKGGQGLRPLSEYAERHVLEQLSRERRGST